ncbi:hypothetical protein ACROYT_G029356 [Oculina patagonica]
MANSERNAKIQSLVNTIRSRDGKQKAEANIPKKQDPKAESAPAKGKRKASEKRGGEFIYLGWKHRKDQFSPYVQVRGVDNGGGLRRIAYSDYSKSALLQRATEIFFPNGKSHFPKAEELKTCTTELGNFAGEPLLQQEEHFSLTEYLSKNGLYASRVRFYLLTTKKSNGGTVDDKPDGSARSSGDNIQLGHSLPSNDASLQRAMELSLNEDQSTVFFIDESRRNMCSEFTRITTSEYSGNLSAVIHSGWEDCYHHRSEEFLDEEEAKYHPCDDSFTMTSLLIADQVYLEPIVDESSSSVVCKSFAYPMADPIPEEATILHGPDELHGYAGNELFIGVLTNFHNEIGVSYEWYLNDNVILRGATHALIKINASGTYYCRVFYGSLPLVSTKVEIREKKLLQLSGGVKRSSEVLSTSPSLSAEHEKCVRYRYCTVKKINGLHLGIGLKVFLCRVVEKSEALFNPFQIAKFSWRQVADNL